ncbi:MAG: nickel pincer cofactor biosynthesis protein LarB [Bryobacteraceae bacterium]|nr:nickel pincer cofactor biosynthesis protein LarB [Solibacteraceae bacterium]MCL4841961.1 nickel pincer cofactor biosynthesis protein LarB [Bryobacteraceae bacterium]MCO5351328.1 nickel pincer cofactor biosynthesis protein LarB [Bryobacteraceae bacterium]
MDRNHLKTLLEQVRDGAIEIDTALDRLKHLPFENIGYANIDHHRAIRVGMPEVIFGKGKTPEEIEGIATRLLERSANVLATRATPEAFERVRKSFPEAEYFPRSGALRVWRDRTPRGKGPLAVVCAGTTDLPVAEEACVTAEIMGNEVNQVTDVGVAGIHRLFGHMEVIQQARVIVVCAGMEGALPSAVGGLVSCPVVAVPTSVGYGASFHGLAALLGMLNSCSSNVSVVNIDNGFGGGYVASLINRV